MLPKNKVPSSLMVTLQIKYLKWAKISKTLIQQVEETPKGVISSKTRAP